MPFVLRIFIAILFIAGSVPAFSAPQLTLDLDSGKVLSHQQAFDPWYPASLTKLMTAYVAFRGIGNGEFTGNKPVRISKKARSQPPSRMAYRTGTVVSLDDALKLLVVKSANDIAVAIAESIAGSTDNFAGRMNREAARLGMTGSRFANPHGLPDKRQITTARDMALLVRAIHREFPRYASLFSTPSVLAPSRTKNNKLIRRVYYSYNLLLERFRGGDGFKTGFICASGYNFIGAATQGGRRIASVVLGRDSQTSRAVDAAKFITEGFRQPLTKGTPISELKPTGPVPTGPRNMRNILCTQKARAARYEPGAGQAVIKSPWLQPRKINKTPLVVQFGTKGPTAPKIARVPLPTFRPAGLQAKKQPDTATQPFPVKKTEAKPTTVEPSPVQPVVVSTLAGRIPTPVFRPVSR